MIHIDSHRLRISETWKYALIGGLLSLPLTIGLYWQSGMSDELSLNMVFIGGVLAGYLARSAATRTDVATAGVRAGLVGSLPGLWFVATLLEAAIWWSSPLWFRVVAVSVLLFGFTSMLLVVSGLVGLLGAKVGGWVVVKTGAERTPPVGD
jgi:hypothetical protein